MAKHRANLTQDEINAANAAAASILEAGGRSEAGRRFLRSQPPALQEATQAMASDHRERMARR